MSVIIRLQNLPLSANAASIRSFFQGLKIPDGGVNIVGGEDGDAFIAFATDDDARKAMLLNNQSINNVQIRLLLSSKQEMQTIISEAQNRVLKRSAAAVNPAIIPPQQQQQQQNQPQPPQQQQQQQHHSQQPPEKRSYTLFNPHTKSISESYESAPNANKMRIIDYSPNTNSFPSKDAAYYDNKVQIIDEPPRPSEFSYKNARLSQQNNINTDYNNPGHNYNRAVYNYDSYDYGFNHHNQNHNRRFDDNRYDNRYDDYEHYSKSGPPPLPAQPHFENSENYEYYSRNEEYCDDRADEYDSYYENENDPYYKSGGGNNNIGHINSNGNGNSLDQYGYRKSLLPTPVMDNNSSQQKPVVPKSLNRYHDYSNRPPWLEESITIHQTMVIRVSLPFSMISEQTIYDIFKNGPLIQKRAVKIELDTEKQPTGYVYVMLSSVGDATKALKMNNRHFRGINLVIESVSEVDYGKVIDNPDNCSLQFDLPFYNRSPFHRDFCVEISNVSHDVNEKDVKDFLNISMDNKRICFIKRGDQTYCLISATDERMMLKILSFNGSIFRFNSIRVRPISKHQLKEFVFAARRDTTPESNTAQALMAARKYLAKSSKNDLSCAKFENLRTGMTVKELSLLFTATIIPMHHIIINRNEAIVDFISAATCQKVIKDLKSKPNIDFTVTPITNEEFQSLKLDFEGPNGRKSVTNSMNKVPSNTSKSQSNNHEKSHVKIRNLSPSIGNTQIKDLIRDFDYQPLSIQICYSGGRHTGEAILTFSNAMEAVTFKDEFHGKTFLQRELEVLLSDRN